jgi:hypothetical protein
MAPTESQSWTSSPFAVLVTGILVASAKDEGDIRISDG